MLESVFRIIISHNKYSARLTFNVGTYCRDELDYCRGFLNKIDILDVGHVAYPDPLSTKPKCLQGRNLGKTLTSWNGGDQVLVVSGEFQHCNGTAMERSDNRSQERFLVSSAQVPRRPSLRGEQLPQD